MLTVRLNSRRSLLLRLAFPDIPVRLVGTLENVELSLPVRAVDFVHCVEYEAQAALRSKPIREPRSANPANPRFSPRR
jgi:hypothetical protein